MSAPDRSTTRCDDLLEFVAAGLKVFGPNCTLRLQIPGAVGRLAFPPDPTWVAPKPIRVQTSAQPTTTRGRNLEIVFGRQRRRGPLHQTDAR
jgi:hypothetical protein